MSTAPVAPVAAIPAKPVKRSVIQIIEEDIANYIRQREQAIANVHAVEGAIQGAQKLVATLRAEEAAAIAEAQKLVAAAKAEAEKAVTAVVAEAEKVETAVAADIKAVAEKF